MPSAPFQPPANPARLPPASWRMLALLACAELLGMSLWFTASATADHFRLAWSLSAGQVGGLTTAVQLGFVAGTAIAALLNVADVLPARWFFSLSALAAATCNFLLLEATSFESALALRFATGLLLAGVYPPALKMTATWFRAGRGLAIGIVVGALTVGKAAPYLVHVLFGSVHPHFVIGSTSAGALAAALLVLSAYRDGPYAFPPRPFEWSLVARVIRHRETRLAIGGYLGHMWELYACWTLIALFCHDYFAARGLDDAGVSVRAGSAAFSVIAIGGVGSVLAGQWADRLGRERVTIWAMATSGACALVLGWLMAAPSWLVLPLALVWGFAIVADSAQFSALVTEVGPADAVGTALTLQTSLGFALTAISIWLTAELAARVGWGVAFSLLAIGPLFGIRAMARLRRLRRQVA